MKRVFVLIMFLFHASYAFGQFIDTKWKVLDFLGEAWFADTKNIIGKTQDFYKGWSKGVFYSLLKIILKRVIMPLKEQFIY